jgi:hypothetical protein
MQVPLLDLAAAGIGTNCLTIKCECAESGLQDGAESASIRARLAMPPGGPFRFAR